MKILGNRTNKRAVVIDTSALIAGFDPFSVSEELYTVPTVRDEILDNTMSSFRFKTAVENGQLRIRKPEKTFLESIRTSASTIGDAFFLSETDMQILALALELKTHGCSPLIATDDYSIQNVANEMGISFIPLSTFGIRRRLQWLRYCPACHKKYPSNYKLLKCQICGTKLKRKPLRKINMTIKGMTANQK